MSYKSSPLIDNMIALRLLTILCTPFNEFPAYKAGLIDEKGKYIVPKHKQTPQQKKSLTYLDRLMINIKKMINKLPGGESKLKNIIAAMVLIKECYQNNIPEVAINQQMLIEKIENYNIKDPQYQRVIDLWCQYIKQKELQKEEVGVGAIAGGGQPPANNTSGIAVTQLPLSKDVVVRRKQRVFNQE